MKRFNVPLLAALTLILMACAGLPFRREATRTPSAPATQPLGSTQDTPTGAPVTQTSTLPEFSPSTETRGYISFIINVHDWSHPGESADTILRLVDLFEKYGVRGDFYFTAEVAHQYVEQRPDVIERLKNSNMTISYHVRPPHPLYTDFDSRLKGLDDATLYQTILDYETFALNLETGDLDRSQAGGYTYVAQTFGRKPVTVPAPNNNQRIKDAAQCVYASLGAQMTLLYHEEGTKVDRPFEYINGLLIRPSDFSTTRTTDISGSDNFWWNYMSKPDAVKYYPTSMLQTQLAEWENHNYGRAPFITSLIHENNFPRASTEGWSSIYFTIDNGKRGDPLSPPYNLNAPDPSRLRPPEEQQAIWDAYEEMVAYAAQNLTVVTSEDIVIMAQNR
jgi:peptidoglycan/xylan/chitin deacetylase (PgdA/CDA1 family)